MGPVAVREHLAPFLPGTGSVPTPVGERTRVRSRRRRSAGEHPADLLDVRHHDGRRAAPLDRIAILSANYVARRLSEHYPVLYTGNQGLVAHECIIDLRPIEKETGVTNEDVAKRLIDYVFHAPTHVVPLPAR